MPLEIVVLIFGWIMALLPVLLYLIITTRLIIGVAKDDSTIMALVSLGATITLIGIGMLLVVYLTDLL